MGTRNQIANIGRQNLDENALVEAGKATIRTRLEGMLRELGLTEAAGFELKLTNGETVVVSSQNNPVLDRPASEVASARVQQSARAGQGFTL